MKPEHNIGGNNKIKHETTATLEVSRLSDKFRHLFVSVHFTHQISCIVNCAPNL